MNIALNLATLRGFGSASLGRHLLRELDRQGTGHSFEAWVPRAWPQNGTAGLERTRVHTVGAGACSKFAAENFSIRRRLARGSADVLFSLGDTSVPRPGIPHLLLVQQAHLAYAAEEWGFSLPPSSRLKHALMARYFSAGLRGVTCFTVQTQDMKSRLARRWHIDESMIDVVPSAVSPEWDRLADGPTRLPPAGPPALCCPSSAAPHKNLPVLIPMLRALKPVVPGLRLFLTVDRQDVPRLHRQAIAAGVADAIVYTGALSQERLIDLVGEVAAVVAPSLLESFGLTYYEAMAAGTPVVAADKAFAREALGEAGLYAAAGDGRAFAAAIISLLSASAAWKAASLSARNRYLRTRHGWSQIGAAYLELLKRISSHSRVMRGEQRIRGAV